MKAFSVDESFLSNNFGKLAKEQSFSFLAWVFGNATEGDCLSHECHDG
jgi:hypothetical protein